jgi:acyl carrier protein
MESQLVHALRRTAFLQSSREIDTSLPLGQNGLGLDSLGIVEFLGAVESDLNIELSEEQWRRAAELSLRDLAKSLGGE